jgi:predicted AAA+ superfamily ATPase
MISNCRSQEFEVISIYGMGGLGKTTLVKHVYQSQDLNAMFDKRACVTIKRPFNPRVLIGSLAAQLRDKQEAAQLHDKKEAAQMGNKQEADGEILADLLQGKRYLIILDDISSTTEWDAVVKYFPTTITTSRIIVTTREENICRHCSKEERNIYKLELLGDEDAQKLFTEKV